MAKRSKSPRKNLRKQLDFYKSDGHDVDIPDIASRERKDAAKVPSRYRYSIGYKEQRNKPRAWVRNEYHKSSSESSYEEESESDSEEPQQSFLAEKSGRILLEFLMTKLSRVNF